MHRSILLAAFSLGLGFSPALLAQTTDDAPVPSPSIRDVVDLPSVSSPRISPDGDTVAYSVRTTDWDENRYDDEIWVARGSEAPFQLTRTAKGSSEGYRWSPDGRYLGFVADRGDGRQVYRISPRGGEAVRLTDFEDGVGSFEWSPEGDAIAIVATDPKTENQKARAERYGDFAVEDEDLRHRHLWLQPLGDGREIPKPRRLTEGGSFTVGGFAFSPDGRRIAFDHQPRPLIDDFVHSDLSIVDIESGEVRALVDREGPDSSPVFSPDGEWVAFASPFGGNPYYGNTRIGRVRVSDGSDAAPDPESLSDGFDEDARPAAWTADGIWFVGNRRTTRRVFLLDPASRQVRVVLDEPAAIIGFDVTPDGSAVAFEGVGPDTLDEIYRAVLAPGAAQTIGVARLTDETKRVADWPLGTREVVRWNSRDGEEIEGVLFLPEGHDRSRPAPLLVVIHGGPTGTSRPTLLSSYVYPVTQWLAQGAMVLMPNYRGSAGYGGRFRALNVRNLGVGDAWDVLSGVDHLIEQGLADPERLGAMGWSQGGYISAFLTTTSDRFRAISDGAGISDWMTYYVNTDIHGFTRQYLEATPWDDPEVYDETSPIHYIENASTPTLIQHGENDQRVPLPNAYELYQGLQDQGVPVRLIVYEGFGHGITKPKERLAATWHNYQWFEKWIWEREVELPFPEDDEGKVPQEPDL